ncbi:uncharacterized protein LOC133124391 isoform X2 [Conger conger]|uniref:uncharacterized protein LOC133124391 isoform X2 n=1 Tax=Conger conger TaxID=82655 RepID=UPI002A5AE4D5|nr:uncharacterized protein LOC133124391 isoform X2 [Conger conger]
MVACETKLKNPTSETITCYLYIGVSAEASRTAQNKGKHCTFTVDTSDVQGREVSCDYSVNTEPESLSPRSGRVTVGKLPKAELGLSRAVISIEESMTLRCRGPDSSPVSHCTFTINERAISGSDCERSVTGAELLSGRPSALNELSMRCFYSLEGRPSVHSDPSTVTVLDLKKPSISVSMKNNQAHIHCEAPADITGAEFFLYSTLSKTLVNSTLAGKEERAAIFTVPHSSDSTLIYCCLYQFKRINSELSDCAEVKNKDQSGGTEDQKGLKAGVIIIVVGILMGMTGVSLYWIHRCPRLLIQFRVQLLMCPKEQKSAMPLLPLK